MNKQKVDRLIPVAYRVLKEVGIAQENQIPKSFRSYVSIFGAAITTGSLIAAVAFFSGVNSHAKEDKTLLMDAIYTMVENQPAEDKSLLWLVCDKTRDAYVLKEDILNAAIALKLAMNMYELI